MNIFQKARLSFQEDKKKLRKMSFWQKCNFCCTYYKGLIFSFIFLCIGLFYLGDVIVQSRTEIVLQGFFANDSKNIFPAKTLQNDFTLFLKLPASKRVSFDDSLYVDPDSSADYAAASQGKIVAYIAAKELDFLVIPESLSNFYISSMPCYDISTLLPENSSLLTDQLYISIDGTGTQKACALKMKQSRYMRNLSDNDITDYYLIVPSITRHAEAIREFIKFSFQ